MPKLDPRVSRVFADGKKSVLPMEATDVFLRERERESECTNALLSISDYLFWQQFQERGRTEAGIQLLSVNLGSTGSECLNTESVKTHFFFWISNYEKVKASTSAAHLLILSKNLVIRITTLDMKAENF